MALITADKIITSNKNLNLSSLLIFIIEMVAATKAVIANSPTSVTILQDKAVNTNVILNPFY